MKTGVSLTASALVAALIGISPSFAQSCPNGAVCETYEYDTHGRLSEVERIKKNSGGSTTETVTVVYSYDDAGNRIIKDTTVA